ncbi:sensor histidine kinase [Furfurilactobacillus rossiae]|jgi:signal transduction histidine kinase|uniref:histidine kinase n=3 Tax=Furfurilactobacillus TaxID=2767882 RepID=A0A0R1R7L7_9LACO|nr:histidine protein kinase [Furfurilactobacillus rossiae DSM 15814]QLE60528.1 sensor histidine kinase [Furfurilactobacillus rossiae]QLE63291.1 sensor histidine kinase [Furfurilactobacillus rossiae]QLE65748.1 sensor histidine kinase [Furfurilactobacillus rossiae]QLE68178.1 sensor histidine kinase [Furfurilactobacillus rossiae]
MMKLTPREKWSLIFEGVVTIVLLLLLNLSLVVILNDLLHSNPGIAGGVYMIKRSLVIGGRYIWSYQNIFIAVMILIDCAVLYWRLIRRYHLYQMNHIIDELHYISDGHLEHRISFKLNHRLQRVVDSVNSLVDSATQSMNDERQAERSKDELITNVSHDIRTPLTSIIGYLGLIENNQYQTDEDLVKYSHIAYLKATQMKSLVEDLFEYLKMRGTEAELTINEINFSQMLEQLAASYELEASRKQLTITSTTVPDNIMMEADAEKLGRVFNNLISNALKYGENATFIELNAKLKGNEVIVRVSNDGREIPTAALNQLFERFYRVEESRSKETGGTGLGLAIAQSIVERHGGYIFAESDENLTSFVIHLPIHHDQPLQQP